MSIPRDMLTTDGQARTTCVHFTGTNTVRFVGSDEEGWEQVENLKCGAGVPYAKLDDKKLPCFMCYGFSASCKKARFRTPEEVNEYVEREHKVWFERARQEAKERVKEARVLPKWSRRRPPNRGAFLCPLCRQFSFRWSRPGTRTVGQCEKRGCLKL